MSANSFRKHILVLPIENYFPKDPPFHGMFAREQAQIIIKAGFKVGVISPEICSLRLLRKGLFKWPRGIQVQHDEGIPTFRYYGWNWIPGSIHFRVWILLKAGIKLFKNYVRRHGMPEILHAHNALYAGILACKLKKKYQIPYVLTEHYTGYARGIISNNMIQYVKNAYENADKRLVVSSNLGHTLEKYIGDSARPWIVAPNVLSNTFEKYFQGGYYTKRYGNSFVFLNIGFLVEKKGQADLLNAFAREFAGENDVQLRIGGDGHLREELELLSKELRIEKQVSFLGMLDHNQVLAEMQNCDVFVLSSHYETFGVVLIEALSCGKPVISTECGGPVDIVRKDNGILIPPKNIEDLGKAMVSMKENIRNYDSVLISKDCIERYGNNAFLRQLSNIYQDVLSKKTS